LLKVNCVYFVHEFLRNSQKNGEQNGQNEENAFNKVIFLIIYQFPAMPYYHPNEFVIYSFHILKAQTKREGVTICWLCWGLQ